MATVAVAKSPAGEDLHEQTAEGVADDGRLPGEARG